MNIAPNGRIWEFAGDAHFWPNEDPQEDPPLLWVAGHTKSERITGSNDGDMYPLYVRSLDGTMIKIPVRIKEQKENV